jgi:hypothetical protein
MSSPEEIEMLLASPKVVKAGSTNRLCTVMYDLGSLPGTYTNNNTQRLYADRFLFEALNFLKNEKLYFYFFIATASCLKSLSDRTHRFYL